MAEILAHRRAESLAIVADHRGRAAQPVLAGRGIDRQLRGEGAALRREDIRQRHAAHPIRPATGTTTPSAPGRSICNAPLGTRAPAVSPSCCTTSIVSRALIPSPRYSVLAANPSGAVPLTALRARSTVFPPTDTRSVARSTLAMATNWRSAVLHR
ncbi:hypothetical protein WR25_19798 [Diploscapter pachys]|uniref:Uncharacterized protein n=1 Tax=Diploscapter pachys TaxID=2018661 RepID=A0A2A2KEH2_9BILA|nr:hypothetical protein WR25_19798 [Diploscapter pachys]